MKKNKLILTGLFLTTAISCSAYRPVVLNAYLDPVSTTEVVFNDINWSYALFNQYGSGLSYEIRLDYSSQDLFQVYVGLDMDVDGVFYRFQDWDYIGPTYATATLSSVWINRFNRIFFNRAFNRTTGKADQANRLRVRKFGSLNILNIVYTIKSNITYNVNIGGVYQAFVGYNAGFTFYKYMKFYDANNNLLQQYLLDTDLSGSIRNYYYDLGSVVTNVKRFDIEYQWVDIPPYQPGDSVLEIFEFNVFSQDAEIKIPIDASGDIFGFTFEAVEWWDILGHLRNFAWWIVNQSPIAPIFIWIDTYIITWISGLVDILVGVFDL